MKKINKIKIKVNGRNNTIDKGSSLHKLVEDIKIPINKVAIELNKEIVNKTKIKKIRLQNNDVEIVHFIGGG